MSKTASTQKHIGFVFENKPILSIYNVASTCDLKQKINIASFNDYKYLSSNLELYRCGYVKDSTMIGRVTVFGNGKMISVGTKSSHQSFLELKKAKRILREYGLSRSKKALPKVRNIVASLSLNTKLDVENIARCIPKSIYEPDIFPAVIVRLPFLATCLVFASGKIIIAGANSESNLNNAVFEIRNRLKDFIITELNEDKL